MNATVAQSFPVASAEDVLNSWKEIASYMNRGIRTVQRWEAELGLPVRRPRGKSRTSVIAMRTDLDQWLRACPVTGQDIPQLQVNSLPQSNELMGRPVCANDLILRSRTLQHNMAHARDEFEGALRRLVETLQRMAQPQVAGTDSPKAA